MIVCINEYMDPVYGSHFEWPEFQSAQTLKMTPTHSLKDLGQRLQLHVTFHQSTNPQVLLATISKSDTEVLDDYAAMTRRDDKLGTISESKRWVNT